ncbi:phage baseplate assembly protein V [Sphingomonas sp. CJ99]
MIERVTKPLADRLRMMVARAIVTAVNDARGVQEVQVELLADEVIDGVEHLQPYGLTAHPVAGAEGVMVAVGGLRSHGLVIAVGDRRYRLQGLAQGEVAVHDDQGQRVLIGRDGIRIESGLGVSIETAGELSIDADTIAMSANSIVLDSNDVSIGSGAVLFAARKTDTATGGTITGGSTKVKIA